MNKNKYVVFKRDELDSWLMSSDSSAMPESLEDAVVIRRQDMFSAPAFDSYANSIQVAIDTLEVRAVKKGKKITREIERLRDIADYFHAQAELAWGTARKIPD